MASSEKPLPATLIAERLKSRFLTFEVCILAGGRSRRMGRDKARLRWQGETFLARLRRLAFVTGFPCRVIRKDRGRSRGPVSGVLTALLTTRADAVLFLPCDMPLVQPEMLQKLKSRFLKCPRPLFAATPSGVGFPLIVPTDALEEVSRVAASDDPSLHSLAMRLGAALYRVPRAAQSSTLNINTPADFERLKEIAPALDDRLSRRRRGGRLSAMKTVAFAALIAVGGWWTDLRAEWVQLKEGNAVVGKVIIEKRDQLFVDVGYTVLAIPRNQVVRVSDNPPSAAATSPPKKASARSSATRTNAPVVPVTEDSAPAPAAGDKSVRELVGELGESVVQVRTPSGLGSGFILDESGRLITNFHVIENETQLSVEVYHQKDGKLDRVSYKQVRIVALNKFADLALLKIEDPGAPQFRKVGLAGSDALSVGEAVFAIGSPLGLERTVTEGIVSTKTRPIQGELYIQTTTQINPGNSGGPLFNLRGEVVGVTNMKMTFGEGLGFAIPVDTLRRFLLHQDAYAYDNDNPSNPYRYLPPPGRTRVANPETAEPRPQP